MPLLCARSEASCWVRVRVRVRLRVRVGVEVGVRVRVRVRFRVRHLLLVGTHAVCFGRPL